MWLLKQKNKTISILLVIILSIPILFPLWQKGFFSSDDGEWMIIRFSAFHQTLADGQFPVRFLARLNHEYGYPVANFLYPGFMYLAEIPKILGFGFVDSIKIILGLSIVGSAIFTYLWLRKIFTNLAALVGALFYLHTPYHLFDLYKRGSVGEILALAVVPFILWSIEQRSFFWTSLGIAMLILSHNTLALLLLPIVIVYMFLRNVLSIKHQVLSIILGLALSAFFWLPAIFDLQYTRFSQTPVSDWQNYFVEFSLISWGTLIIFITFFIKYFRFNDLNHFSKLALMFFSAGVGSIFLSLSYSSFFWQILPVGFIQFPFRFLSITILSAAFLSAFVIDGFSKKKKLIASIMLLTALLVSAIPYLKPTVFFDKGEGFYATNQDSTTVQNEYMPIWVKSVPLERAKEKVEIVEGVGTLEKTLVKSNKISLTAKMKTDGKIRINTVYFPGWKTFIDEKEVIASYDYSKGLMGVEVAKGEHNVKLIFGETPFRLGADALSVAGFLLLIVFSRKKK